jgi:hypothetical protein
MGNYQSLNVLNQRKDYMSDDAVMQVANMINSSNANRKQRRSITKSLGKMENILSHTQKHIDKTAFKEYQKACDENMRRFFSILSIVLKREYNFEESDDKEEISEMLCKLNEYLEEYKGYTTDELTDICFEETEIKLVSK